MTEKFIRQDEADRNKVTLLIPQTSAPPVHYSFHYIPQESVEDLLEDGAEISIDAYRFKIKDGILGVFETVALSASDFGWSFSSSRALDVLAAVKIGETINVRFDVPFGEVYKISRSQFPSGVLNCGYGKYKFHLTETAIRPEGFSIVSSFEEGQEPTDSRLPFFFGFRVFGSRLDATPEPIWRTFLASSIRYSQEEKWHLSILHSAFCLESFLDTLLKQKLSDGGISDEYIDHILRVGEKRDEFQAINKMILNNRFTRSQVNKLYEQTNRSVFTKRNGIAHGRTPIGAINSQDALEAIRSTISLIWDFDRQSRSQLLIVVGGTKYELMIDEELLADCGINP